MCIRDSSSTAALVAAKASSRRSFASFISVSVAAPTRITATPPDNLANLSCNFSLSKSEDVYKRQHTFQPFPHVLERILPSVW